MLTAASRPLAAQTLRGIVRDSANHAPIAGAVVMLLDSAGTVLRRNLTDERGRYGIVFSNAARSMRLIRIGLQPRMIALALPPDFNASLDVSMLPATTTLSAVRVQDKSQCPQRKDDAAAFALWEQAGAGLLATVVAREANPAGMEALLYERTLDHFSSRITRFKVDHRISSRADRSFQSAFAANEFVRSGFSYDSSGTRIMFGPDADVLLDAAFAAAYCFHVADASRARPRQVGLAFAPAKRSDDRVDIDGTLWVDTAARALTDIEFRYVGLPPYMSQFSPGGTVSFGQMPNGVVVIDRWQLRAVIAGNAKRLGSSDVTVRNDLIPMDFGGELASATWDGGLTWRASLGTLKLHATGEGAVPARGMVIGLRDTHYRDTTNAHGDVLITKLLPGPYNVEVWDPRLFEAGIAIPTAINFTAARDSTFRVTNFFAMSPEDYVVKRCVDEHQGTAGQTRLLLGRVVTSNGDPVNGATLNFAIKSVTRFNSLREHYETGSDGTFALCTPNINIGSTVRISVLRDKLEPVDTVFIPLTRLTVLKVRVPAAP
jgi:hypothetical protein